MNVRRVLFLVAGAILVVCAAAVAVMASQGVPYLPLTFVGGRLLGLPDLDYLFIVRLLGRPAALITAAAVLACGTGAHLLRLGLLRRPRLPRPADWPPYGQPLLAAASALFGALLAASLMEGLRVAPDNQVLVGFGGLLATSGLLMPLLTSLYRVRAPRLRVSTVDGEPATRIARSGRSAVLNGVLSLWALLIGVVAVHGLVSWASGDPAVTVDPQDGPVVLLLGAAIGILGLVGLLAVLYPLLRREHLLLTPSRVVVGSVGSSAGVPWHAVQTALADQLRQRPEIYLAVAYDQQVTGRQNTRLNQHLDDKKLVCVPFQRFAIDPTTLLHLYAHYHAYPERRPELGTSAANDRVISGDLLSPAAASPVMADPADPADVRDPQPHEHQQTRSVWR
jgi:hypothetical protein